GAITFAITQVLPSAHYMGFRTQLRLPDRPEEVDVHDVVVNDSLGASVEAKAMPIAASARSHKTPPCIVPMGLACCGPACKEPTACPSLISSTLKPINSATAGLEASTFSISGCLVGDSALCFSAITLL